MFHQTRIKLTIWYSLIIMFISVLFSIAIYKGLTSELDRVERMQRLRIERRFSLFNNPPPLEDIAPGQFYLDPALVAETKQRLVFILALINVSILALSAGAGYILAGKTLEPIKNMLDEQNRFVTDASHELRTPLTSLKTEIEVNLRDTQLNLAQARQVLTSNLEEVNNLQSLSDNLIKLSQYQNVQNHNFSTLSLLNIINESIKKVSNIAKKKKITIKSQLQDINISGNEAELTELFVIFLDNAIKYSSNNSQILLQLIKSDHHAIITFQDQGIGISKEDLPHIFNRFYRTKKSRSKDEVTGYGLGLAIAKQIVDTYNGTITVNSQLNKGTTFVVKLPVN